MPKEENASVLKKTVRRKERVPKKESTFSAEGMIELC